MHHNVTIKNFKDLAIFLKTQNSLRTKKLLDADLKNDEHDIPWVAIGLE